MINLFLGPARADIFVFPPTMYLQIIFVAVAFLGALLLLAWLLWRYQVSFGKALKVALSSVLVMLLGYHALFAWGSASGHQGIAFRRELLPLAHPLTANRLLARFGVIAAHAAETTVGEGGALAYPLEPLRCEQKQQIYNILLLVIDSWRFDALNAETTPNIYRYAAQGAVFDNHFSTSNSTRAGIFGLFYGLPGTYWHSFLGEQRGPALLDELLNADYEPAVFASANLTSPEFHRTVFARLPNLRVSTTGVSKADRDRTITEDFHQFLQNRQQTHPFFGFLFYDSAHGYDFPKEYPVIFKPMLSQVNYLDLDQEFDPTPLMNRYRNSVHYVDSLIGGVLDLLHSSGELEQTIVVITGDHGQELNDNRLNYWGHNGNFSRFQTQVPLVIMGKEVTPTRYSHRTTHLDIAPTMMARVLGCTNDMTMYSSGMDLFDKASRGPVLLSTYNDKAILDDANNLTVFSNVGRLERLDADYRPLTAPVDGELVRRALAEMRRFYRQPD